MAEKHPPSLTLKGCPFGLGIAGQARNDDKRLCFAFLGSIVFIKNINYLNNIALGMMPASNEPSNRPSSV